MPAGDIQVNTLKIGDIDLASFNQASYAGFNIYEDIFSTTGPVCDIRVIDHSDALGKTKLNGDYQKDIQISFSLSDGFIGAPVNFKFKMFQNKNLNDGGLTERGSGHYKEYDIRGVSQELLNAQGNYIQKNYNDQTSKMVEEILKNGFKTDKQIEIKDSTKGSMKYNFNRVHPIQALKELNDYHVSSTNESSCYVCFQQADSGNQKYVFSTFEELFKQAPVVNLKQSTTLDYGNATNADRQNSIMWMNVGDSFFTPTRPLSKTSRTTYNLVTGKQQTDNGKDMNNFTLPDQPTYNSVSNVNNQKDKQTPVLTPVDPSNHESKTYIADARVKRKAFLSHLAQNYATLEVYGNPQIKLGSMINLDIFKKVDSDMTSGETQFNGKALVVSIRHKVKPLGQSPRYTMILGVVKASYKEGGGGNG